MVSATINADGSSSTPSSNAPRLFKCGLTTIHHQTSRLRSLEEQWQSWAIAPAYRRRVGGLFVF
jgi:hypothetical protein